jgi:signal transduction histidine kinase
MNNLEGQQKEQQLRPIPYTPTFLQTALGEPLRSEQRINEFFPRGLSRGDLMVIFIAIVLFIPNASIVQATQGAGGATYIYWLIGTITFLLPGALVAAQLYRFMPVDGSIYVWTHRALGPLFGFFAAFCAWFPGVLVLLAASDSIVALIQGIGAQASGPNANWLDDPHQQGLVVIGVLLLAALVSMLSLRSIMKIATVVIILYGAGIFLVGMAGVVWLLSGHQPAIPLTSNTLGFSGQNLVLYGVIVLALLGVEVPLNMAGEEKQGNAAMLFLRWGPLLVLIAYLLGTFGVMAVVPPGSAGASYSTLTAVALIFGIPASLLIGLLFIGFFFIAAVIYNIAFARILFVSALDHRLPPALAKVNRFGAPYRITNVQITIVIIIAIFTFFVGPLLYNADPKILSGQVYNISQATTTVIWCISMIILFLDLPVLLRRFRALFAQKRVQLITAPWVLYLACIVGTLASVLGIWTTLTRSWNTQLLSNSDWALYVGVSVLICLVIGLIGSAYPRLLGSLDQQTEAARENARLYNDLRLAYEKLSQLDQLKDAFLTTASHELRTPLTIVQGYLELLGEMQDADLETRQSFLTKARRACDELVLLQANIMDASRVQFDAASLVHTNIPLKEVATSIIDLFEPLILQQEREVELRIDPDIIVWADETRLKQILRNLFANALRYSPEKTPIRITANIEPGKHMARVNVIDYGGGIPPDKQETIFDKFVRLERDMHGNTRGSGLGLYITQQLVEAMNGKITVKSSGIDGEGSIFSFTIPLKKVQTRPL